MESSKAIDVFLCTTSGREWIWSTSTSLFLIRVLVLGKKLVMYSCIYDKNKSPMFDLCAQNTILCGPRTTESTMVSDADLVCRSDLG